MVSDSRLARFDPHMERISTEFPAIGNEKKVILNGKKILFQVCIKLLMNKLALLLMHGMEII
jgi:hypothetical protein